MSDQFSEVYLRSLRAKDVTQWVWPNMHEDLVSVSSIVRNTHTQPNQESPDRHVSQVVWTADGHGIYTENTYHFWQVLEHGSKNRYWAKGSHFRTSDLMILWGKYAVKTMIQFWILSSFQASSFSDPQLLSAERYWREAADILKQTVWGWGKLCELFWSLLCNGIYVKWSGPTVS